MIDAYKGRGNVSWDAMQRALETNKPAEINEATVRAVLEELPSSLPSGQLSTQRLSQTLSLWLLYMGARYGSDTRQAATVTLSEFMETVSRTPSISGRQQIALATSKSLLSHGLSERDHLMLQLDMLNEAGNDRIVWEAVYTPERTILVRARLTR